ncbi:MAG: nucleotidyltransferase [Bacteroidales bacterium]|jgi:UTP-glucose-1-phosphate uridylyltransferase|nr:nucleotidyltransferase [Bacteroidales bacterium]
MNHLTLVVLAAGMGSRYGGLKQIEQFGTDKKTIIDYNIYDAVRYGFEKIVFVIRKDIEADFEDVIVKKYRNKLAVEYVYQELNAFVGTQQSALQRQKPWGTAHAVLTAKKAVNTYFAVINGDDFYGQNAFEMMSKYLQSLSMQTSEAAAMVAYLLQNTLSENGTVSRGICNVSNNQQLIEVKEYTKIAKIGEKILNTASDGSVTELSPFAQVSMNFWGFHPAVFAKIETLFAQFLKENAHKNDAEFYIPSVVDNLIKTNQMEVKVLPTSSNWYGVTYQADKETVGQSLIALEKQGLYNGWLP